MDKSRAIIPKHFRQCGSFWNIVTKFDVQGKFWQFWLIQGPYLYGIWLVIKLGQEIMPTNNVTKFDDYPLKNIQVTERPRFILAILANSRAITPKCFMGSGWLSNLAEIFCQQTFSQSLTIIQWKLLKFLSGQMLWTPP